MLKANSKPIKYIYIYIYIEREREREREDIYGEKKQNVYLWRVGFKLKRNA